MTTRHYEGPGLIEPITLADLLPIPTLADLLDPQRTGSDPERDDDQERE